MTVLMSTAPNHTPPEVSDAKCRACHGQGCEAHECDDGRLVHGPACQRCGGSGKDQANDERRTCPDCYGAGHFGADTYCSRCGGSGRVAVELQRRRAEGEKP